MRVKRGAAHALEIFEGEAELGEHFFVGNGFVILESFPGRFDGAHLFFADRFVVNGSVGETVGHRISHHFEQMNDGGNLARSQPLDQIMGLLFFVCGCHQE